MMAQMRQQLNIAAQLPHKTTELMTINWLNSTCALLPFVFQDHCRFLESLV